MCIKLHLIVFDVLSYTLIFSVKPFHATKCKIVKKITILIDIV